MLGCVTLVDSLGVHGRGRFAGTHLPFKLDEVSKLTVKGRPLCRHRFMHELNTLVPAVDAKPPQERHEHFVRVLVQLVLDNGLRTPKQIERIAAKKFGKSLVPRGYEPIQALDLSLQAWPSM